MTAPVTTLSDVLIAVRDLFIAVGDVSATPTNPPTGIEMLFGERYLKQRGSAQRIVFVRGDGNLGGPLEIGAREVGSIGETVECYVWGVETADDINRHRAAEAIAHRLMNAFECCAPGRHTSKIRRRNAGTNVLTFGEELVLEVEYTYAVPVDDDIWDAAYAAAPSPALSPPDPDRPNGDTGDIFTVDPITLANERP